MSRDRYPCGDIDVAGLVVWGCHNSRVQGRERFARNIEDYMVLNVHSSKELASTLPVMLLRACSRERWAWVGARGLFRWFDEDGCI